MNVPCKARIGDAAYAQLFQLIMCMAPDCIIPRSSLQQYVACAGQAGGGVQGPRLRSQRALQGGHRGCSLCAAVPADNAQGAGGAPPDSPPAEQSHSALCSWSDHTLLLCRGRGYAVNVPCKAGIGDAAYAQLFQPIMRKVLEVYRPEIIVYQSGADSLTGDRLGMFNLSTVVRALSWSHSAPPAVLQTTRRHRQLVQLLCNRALQTPSPATGLIWSMVCAWSDLLSGISAACLAGLGLQRSEKSVWVPAGPSLLAEHGSWTESLANTCPC